MREFLFSIGLGLFMAVQLPAQVYDHKPGDFIIIIDGRIPLSYSMKIDIGNGNKSFNFYHYFGSIITDDNWEVFDSIPDTTSIVTNISFRVQVENEVLENKYIYKTTWEFFKKICYLMVVPYGKSNKNYFIHAIYEPPLVTKVQWNKKMGSKAKFYKKIYRGLHPYKYWSKKTNLKYAIY